jgi:hypothetical protein
MKLPLAAACLVFTGCLTLPSDPATTSAASYVGDRTHLALDEIVVGVAAPGAGAQLRNLHVGLAAIINAKEVTYADPYDVEWMVRRMEPRIAARVVELALGAGPVGPGELRTLRGGIATEAQAAFDAAFARWKHAAAFEVDLVVTSLYLTDGSVGREVRGARRWW